MPLRVLVDMDGVLCDFETHMLSEFRRLHPDEPFVELCDRRTFLMTEQYDSLRPGLGPLAGAVEALSEMSKIPGVEISLCTTPIREPYYCAQEKYEWVRKHLGDELMHRMILTYDKTLVMGDILIDDKHVITGSVSPRCWDHVLFTQDHNRHVFNGINGANFVCRLDNWTDGSWRTLINSYLSKIDAAS